MVVSSFSAFTFSAATSSATCPPTATGTLGQIANAKFPLSVCVVDSFGNIYSLTVSGSASSYTIRGQMVYSSYLSYIPWQVVGIGKGTHFAWKNIDPNPSDPDFCSWTIVATISGQSASGTFLNLACGHETGPVAVSLCTISSCVATSSDDGIDHRAGS